VSVSWFDAVQFCNKLSQQQHLEPYYEIDGENVSIRDQNGNGFRLPTEAEWEYACRAGTTEPHYFGTNLLQLGEHAWHNQNRTRFVGQGRANPFGLYDVYGNVWEWCDDSYGIDFYSEKEASIDPKGPTEGPYRVCRGGGRQSSLLMLRSAARMFDDPKRKRSTLGFRIARTLHKTVTGTANGTAIVNPLPPTVPKDPSGSQKPPPVKSAKKVAGLKFSGDGHAVIRNVRYDGSFPLTVEAFITPSRARQMQSIIANWQRGGIGMNLDNGYWGFSVHNGKNGKNYRIAISDQRADPGKRVHIVGTCDGRRVQLFVDGKLQSKFSTL